ncbi:excisionase family DNA-binding protein [Lederbergia citrea]|uniref:Excisionase family DNA-binding protein n=1 Tax=Lederbergia citrea TaxID=2833581 RepID=A0A942UTN0_9BACI|nr:excisionase family DNA-binding protein [Lederbergia citrea]MBS4179339.1 excisionase family DNA-binding protein [Lederbergia citrea]MBS4206008.1 excisionase family DNA-binding protein [Lederbergia citrea]MBS4224543.1 excisionase family DNA-binding protein [Lederbergia citrea]
MYLSIEETAEYLQFPVSYIESLIQQGKIRAVHDGERYMINKEQFTTHLEQMEKYKRQLEEYLAEPLPEDLDIKDED